MKDRINLVVLLVVLLLASPLAARAQETGAGGDKTDGATLGAGGIKDADVPSADRPHQQPVRKVKSIRGVETYWGNEDLKDVVKGFYLNTRAGYMGFAVGDLKKETKGGFAFGGGFGYDVIDQYLALEIDAIGTACQSSVLLPDRQIKEGSVVKGDFTALRVPLAVHIRYFTTKRLELYVAPLAGLWYNAQAIKKTTEDTNEVKAAHQLDGFAGGRLGIEYYTGLRHFSLGLDVEFDYIFSAKALAVAVGPMMKYTF